MEQLSPLVDAQAGIVFGYGWGTHVADFLRDCPRAERIAERGDIEAFELGEPSTLHGVPVRVVFEFQLGTLVTVKLDVDPGVWSRRPSEASGRLVERVSSWFLEPLDQPDEALLVGEDAGLRATLDLAEGRLTLEDPDL
jgi:hypothetical protein